MDLFKTDFYFLYTFSVQVIKMYFGIIDKGGGKEKGCK